MDLLAVIQRISHDDRCGLSSSEVFMTLCVTSIPLYVGNWQVYLSFLLMTLLLIL